jgi:hypothetical protein
MGILAQTVQLGLRIGIVWAAGILLAVGVRAVLPNKLGITFYGSHEPVFVPFSRLGFWTCLLAAVTVTALVVVRAMLADLGVRPPP